MKGWPTPHSRFCSASANAYVSRPQSFAWMIGVWKKPRPERGPNVKTAATHPQATITAGVRQEGEGIGASALIIGFSSRLCTEWLQRSGMKLGDR
jgi:hypothetical protein